MTSPAIESKPVPKHSRRRRFLRVLGAVVLVMVALFLVVAVGLRTRTVRGWITGRVATTVEQRTGYRLAVEDWRVGLVSGRFQLDGVVLRNSDGRAMLQMPRATGEVSWSSLLSASPRLLWLTVERPRFDLAALETAAEPTAEGEPWLESPVRIDRLRIGQGELGLPPMPETAAGWLDAAAFSAIELEGELGRTHLDLRLLDARLRVVAEQAGPPIELTVKARLAGVLGSGTEAGLRLSDLEIVGPGLLASGDGRLGLEAGGPASLDFQLAADAGQLFPKLSSAGTARIEGHADLTTRRVDLDLELEDFPARIFEPILGADTFARLDGERTTLDATATLKLDLEAQEPVQANADVEWIGRLFTAHLETDGGGRDADGALDLRTLRGTLTAQADGAPSELLRPWIGRQRFEEMGLGQSLFDLDLDVASTSLDESSISGSASATWRRGRSTLATGSGTAQWVLERGRDGGITGVDLARGTLKLAAPDLDAALIKPFVPAAANDRIGIDGTRLSLSADLGLGGTGGRRDLTGQAQLGWRRGEQVLGSAEVEGRESSGPGLRLGYRVELLPQAPGLRRFTGEIATDSRLALADTLDDIQWQEAGFALEFPDVLAFHNDLLDAFPGLADLVPADLVARGQGSLEAKGSLSGPLFSPAVQADARWMSADRESSLGVELAGTTAPLDGRVDLDIGALDLGLFTEELAGRVSGRIEATGSLESYRAAARLESETIQIRELEPIRDLKATLSTDGQKVEVAAISGRWRGGSYLVSGEADVPSLGDAKPALPNARFDIVASDPWDGLQRVAARFTVDAGTVALETTDFESDAGTGRISARAPAQSLEPIPQLESFLAWFELPERAPSDRVRVDIELPEVDSQRLLAFFDREPIEQHLAASEVRLVADLDLAEPRASSGTLEVGALTLESEKRRFESDRPLMVRLADGAFELATIGLVEQGPADAGTLEVSGRALLAPDFDPNASLSKALASYELQATGQAPAAVLNPFLGGGFADGPLQVEATLAASGSLNDYRGRIVARGENAVLFYQDPYETRLEAPEVTLAIDSSGIRVESSSARLNQGTLEIDGPITGEQGLALAATFEQVRYRLDYGLVALLSGNLDLRIPKQGTSTLEGVIAIERGVVRGNLDLERELRGLLLGIPDLAGTEESFAQELALDVTVLTYSGVKVANNIANLTAVWTPLLVRGTLAEPLIEGRIEVDPGGLFFAYGQVFRLDQASVEMTGIPGSVPKLDGTMTSSIEDPTLLRGAPKDPFAPAPDTSDTNAQQAVAAGLVDYYGGQLSEVLGQSLGGVRFEIEPLLLFAESDPDARFTVSQDLNQYLALGVSLNLREADSRTYLLDLHDLGFAPGVTAQVFTNEAGNEGVTLQHGLDLGKGSAGSNVSSPIARLRIPKIPHIDARRLRRALDYKEGDQLPEGGLFDLEVETTDYLRRNGYPAARVTFTATRQPNASGKSKASARPPVDIEALIVPGPWVTFEFTGDLPASSARPEIRARYRSGFYEESALEAMRALATNALRARGFLFPEIEITVQAERPDDPESPRTVTVDGRGGRQIELRRLTIAGVSEEEVEILGARFLSPLSRVELAAGVESADHRLLAAARGLGYPEPTIASRALSDDGHQLTVQLAAGEVVRVSRIDISGLDEADRMRLLPLVPLRAGSPLRTDVVARSVFGIEQDLRRRGHADARVRSAIGHTDDRATAAVTFAVTPGPVYRLDEIDFEGERATRLKWALRQTDLESGDLLDQQKLAEARKRLLRTGSFDSVSFETRRTADGDADVLFQLEERPRYRLSYGLRFETTDGLAAVVDVRDRNLFGRGITLGARVLEAGDDRIGRLFGSVPRLFGSRYTLELLGEVREQIDEGLIEHSQQASIQLSRRYGSHLTGRVYGRYRVERFREQDPDPFFPIDERLSSPFVGIQMVYDRRQGDVLGRRGLFASVDISGADQFLGSDFRYLRGLAQASYVRPIATLGTRTLTWAQSYHLGLAQAFGEQTLLRDSRFYAGGEYSVRGYRTESLGPVEDLGFISRPLGGTALSVLSQELRLPIVSRYSGVVFFDAGNVYTSSSDLFSNLSRSAGLGLRTATPLGLLRLDIAFPLDRRPEDDKFKIYIGLGHVF